MGTALDSKIFDTLLEPTFLINAQKQVIYCNESAALICDLSARKIQRSQTPIDEIFKFKEPVHGLAELAKLTDASPYQELNFETQSGKSGKVQITIQPFDPDPQNSTWLVYFRDVTLEETLQKKYRAELEQKEDVINDLRKAQAELKNYSENLEKMVAERTAEISRLNQTMAALLDSLSQGFFLFDQQGDCLEVYSKACLETVQTAPFGKKIWEVLGLQEKQVPGFKKWITTVFAEMLPFEDLVPLAPPTFPHSAGKHIHLEYYPLRNKDNGIAGVVVVASDITSLIQAQQDAETERTNAKMILTLVKNKYQFAGFLREAQVILNNLKAVYDKDPFDAEDAFRLLHTMKGGTATFSIKSVAELCHSAETALSAWKQESSAENFQKLKELSFQVSEKFSSFLQENKVIIGEPEKSKQRWVEIPVKALQDFVANPQIPMPIQTKFTEEFLMEPVSRFVSHYNDVMQQVAQMENKQLGPLVLINAEIKVIPEPYETLFATLIHAYRNAVDHGIETADVRESAGKPPEGKIQTAFNIDNAKDGPWLKIEIKDDGGGISADKIRARLKAKGISADSENDLVVIQHVFDSEFSTKESVTVNSGRGVGMDAILHAATNLGGRAWVESVLNQGTTLVVRVPYLTKVSNLKKLAS